VPDRSMYDAKEAYEREDEVGRSVDVSISNLGEKLGVEVKHGTSSSRVEYRAQRDFEFESKFGVGGVERVKAMSISFGSTSITERLVWNR
jgi:hypothetical protein